MFKKNNLNNGFTLIELITVIAVIGILAGSLFVLLNPKERTLMAEDSKIKYSVDNIRLAITDYFSKNNYSYKNLENDNQIKTILAKLPDSDLKSNEDKWAIKTKLNNGKEFCRDSSGKSSEKENQDISDYFCD